MGEGLQLLEGMACRIDLLKFERRSRPEVRGD
jgi:hypothetical protein